jgi:hypothetical protein
MKSRRRLPALSAPNPSKWSSAEIRPIRSRRSFSAAPMILPYLSASSSLLSVALNWICSIRAAISPVVFGSRHVRRHLHDEDVRRFRGADKRNERRVGGVAAVPVGLAVQFDRLMDERQTSRSEHGVDRQLHIGQDAQTAVADARGAEQELDLRAFSETREVHFLGQRVA